MTRCYDFSLNAKSLFKAILSTHGRAFSLGTISFIAIGITAVFYLLHISTIFIVCLTFPILAIKKYYQIHNAIIISISLDVDCFEIVYLYKTVPYKYSEIRDIKLKYYGVGLYSLLVRYNSGQSLSYIYLPFWAFRKHEYIRQIAYYFKQYCAIDIQMIYYN